jgi:hypothetical protein
MSQVRVPPARVARGSQVQPATPSAVLVDGSALYLAAKNFYDARQLNYFALVELLTSKISGLRPPSSESRWVMWTASSPQNVGQGRFLDFAEQELNWSVRRFSPAESFTIEPATLIGLSPDKGAANRLMRFDASIAFAIGRLADQSRVVVLSDSFALAEPLRLASQIGLKTGKRPVLAFFGRALDSRWQGVLRKEAEQAPEFIDLDDFEDLLFGQSPLTKKRSDGEGDIVF